MTTFKRRDVVHTLVGVASAAAFGVHLTAAAQADDEQSMVDRALLRQPEFDMFRRFIRLSAALTGIAGVLLEPAVKLKSSDKAGTVARDALGRVIADGADPMQAVKAAYFWLATSSPHYPELLREFETPVGQ